MQNPHDVLVGTKRDRQITLSDSIRDGYSALLEEAVSPARTPSSRSGAFAEDTRNTAWPCPAKDIAIGDPPTRTPRPAACPPARRPAPPAPRTQRLHRRDI